MSATHRSMVCVCVYVCICVLFFNVFVHLCNFRKMIKDQNYLSVPYAIDLNTPGRILFAAGNYGHVI